jgi:hypothetical protein
MASTSAGTTHARLLIVMGEIAITKFRGSLGELFMILIKTCTIFAFLSLIKIMSFH